MSLGWPELVFVVGMVICIGGTVFWIKMLIECATKEADTGNTKVAWIIVIAVAHVIGAAIYYFVRRPQRYADLHR